MTGLFVQPRRLADPELTLVVFHHAGGSAAGYHPLTRWLPASWDLLILDMPGRGKRVREPLPETPARFYDGLRRDLLSLPGTGPYALFGHSLGAVVAVEAAYALRERGMPPVWVGVCGRLPPGRSLRTPGLAADMPDDRLLAALHALGGLPDGLDSVPAFQRRFLELLRHDLRILDAHRPDPARGPLAVPLTVFGSTDDPLTPVPELAGWAAVTTAPVRQRIFQGGHFPFRRDGFRELGAAITTEIRALSLTDGR
ncbi:S-acyl fatty acid synthase thioesterase, medium chain [Actinoplanes sp. SE50]|uniref:thioesterase II family protein n=1 Tax=unclassified Actinoplanes TaxID=2626549 RepID=UPI00023EC502|nr:MULTISPECIES: alpha/beta fold hydrolase [unclassified Actinoplanes]AEV87031.1 S-acyl fatty acid synthase thioesterase, medium chain [Actinoplanes sp. SE50/110]ATO85429.1 S-acyl fatty acid synthase thioesterase, medium chain [Actinoplanes sp. SE50]SLM02841.1 thioesterase [Actinoplanes sp. SE50/110]